MLRLAGIDVAAAGARGAASRPRDATAALAALVAGQALELRSAGNASDRHGRVVAQLFAGGRWVQGELLRRGLARVAGRADNRAGLAAMLALEDEAREARRGLWRLAFFAVRAPSDAARDAGSFQIVEGTVADAALVAGGAYVNFGADWRNSFSLRIGRDALRAVPRRRARPAEPQGRAAARARLHRRHAPPADRRDLPRTDRAALSEPGFLARSVAPSSSAPASEVTHRVQIQANPGYALPAPANALELREGKPSPDAANAVRYPG